MVEEPSFPGLWTCLDGKVCLNPNDGPPFQFKCRGIVVTQKARDAFDAACLKIIAERN
jgi:hypothetical protein